VAVAAAPRLPARAQGFVPAAAGIAVVAGLVLRRRRLAPTTLLAGIAATAAAYAGWQATLTLTAARNAEALPVVDLATGAVPRPLPSYLAVEGFIQPSIHLAEYDVPPDAIPDQARPPEAVVAVVTATADPVQPNPPVIVLARLPPGALPADPTRRVVRGKVVLPPPSVLPLLADVSGEDPPDAIVVDTLDLPRRAAALGPFVLAVLATAAAATAAAAGRPPRPRA